MLVVPNTNAHAAIARRIEFRNHGGTLRGEIIADSRSIRIGLLGGEDLDKFREDAPTYIVFSYKTPVAWHGENGWTFPRTDYSQTTRQHKTLVRRGIALSEQRRIAESII